MIVKCMIAIVLYRCGVRCGVSSGIHGGITYGYGRLDDNGFWEYDLPPRYVKSRRATPTGAQRTETTTDAD